jgi:hypothetical protein
MAVRARRAAVLAIAGSGLLAAAGCGGGNGAGQANTLTHATASMSPGVPQTAAPPAKPALTGVRPCDLLSATDRSTVGLTSTGTEKQVGPARACDWTEPGAYGLTVTVDDAKGLSGLNIEPGSQRRFTLGGHQAVEVADRKAADGTCAVLLAAGNSASVQIDAGNTTFRDTALACSRANTAAKLIEPKLP